MMNFYRKFISPGDLCFDIGANVGDRTDIFLKIGAKVVAVEPQVECLKILNKKCGSQATIVNSAVGSNESDGMLMLCDETDQCASLSTDFITTYSKVSGLHWTKQEKVRITTLDNLCRKYGIPQFCKIDVEGYEPEVFKGLNTPINFISFEFNRYMIQHTYKSLQIIDNKGNYHCNFIQYEFMELMLPAWIPLNEFSEKLEKLISPDILTGEILLKHIPE